MKNQKLINSICDLVSSSNKPLNQKLEIWWKLDKASIKELKQIESKLITDIYQELWKQARKIQGL